MFTDSRAAVTASRIQGDGPDGLGYTQFCVHYRRWRACQDGVMRQGYVVGERMFVDFAGDAVPVTDPETGEVWNAQVLVSVLCASGYDQYLPIMPSPVARLPINTAPIKPL